MNNRNIARGKSAEPGRSEVEHPFIMTVCSGKGGVGKSFLSANLALSLSANGLNVALWDADAQFPNLHILLGIEPPVRIHDVYNGKAQTDAALCPIEENLALLAGKTGMGAGSVSASGVYAVYRDLVQRDIDAVIIDSAAGATDDILQCCTFSDLIAIVATDEPTSIVDAYGLVKILRQSHAEGSVGLLVSNTIDDEDANDVTKKLNLATEKFLNLRVPFLGYIPYDRQVRASIIEQRPLVRTHPDSDAALAITRIARSLTQRIPKITRAGV